MHGARKKREVRLLDARGSLEKWDQRGIPGADVVRKNESRYWVKDTFRLGEISPRVSESERTSLKPGKEPATAIVKGESKKRP